MPHQQNPERRSADAVPGAGRPPRNPGHHTATPDAPQLPRQRHEPPARPPLNATPPGGRPATPGRAAPPGGRPPGRPAPAGPVNQQRPTRVVPGPGTPEVPPSGDSSDGGPTGKSDKPESDLNVNKVVAGAGAAIVTAILGSFLGAVGTILGAALGSIVTTFATTFFQRSIEHTRTKVTGTSQRLKERKAGPAGTAVWQASAQGSGAGPGGPDGQETVLLDPSGAGTSPPGRVRRIRMTRKQIIWSAVGTVLAFALAMFLVTGIEWIKGGSITGDRDGTSISNAVSGAPARQTEQNDTGGSDATPTSEPSTSSGEPDSSSSSTATEDPSSTSESGSDSSSESSNPLQDGLNGVLPSQQPESGQLQSGQSGQDGQNGSGNSGGGAAESN